MLQWAVVALAASIGAILTIFLLSLAATALKHPGQDIRHLAQNELNKDRKLARAELSRLKKQLKASRSKSKKAANTRPSGNRIVLAYYAPWESAAMPSFSAFASSITHVAPAWLHLSPDGLSLDQSDFDTDPHRLDVLSVARKNSVRVVPLITNAIEGEFSRKRAAQFLRSAEAQSNAIRQMIDMARKYRFQGYQVDFEDLDDSDYSLLARFLSDAHRQFKQSGLELSVACQVEAGPNALKSWSDEVDFLVLMTYDEHSEDGSSGPIASLPWFEDQLDKALEAVPANKLIAGIGSYAYDWVKGKKGADAISFQEAMAEAAGYRDDEPAVSVISLDPDSLNTSFTYEDEDGKSHDVWMLDSISAYNQMVIARKRAVRGAAVWALGTEDPDIWQVVGRNRIDKTVSPDELASVRYPFEVNYYGKGEVLKVESRPSEGRRRITVDSDTGMIDSVSYEAYPTTYVIRKSGYKKNKVVLTFDDGPDPTWTPQILDVLKDKHAPAAFFVVGQNVESNPSLIERMVREGHEIGSHTFTHPNLGLASDSRTDLELSATQRVIEAISGRSTILFRPPYNADSQPETADEVRSIVEADSQGYITIGENIDPNDWAPNIVDEDGTSRPRTADDIIRLVLSDLQSRKGTGEEGNIILLHDAGGERAQTVAALPRLIDSLRSQGYEVVSLANLLDKPESKLMPPIPARDQNLVKVDRVVFNLWHIVQVVLFWGFVGALVLGTARVLIVTPLALVSARRKSRIPSAVTLDREPVSVLIAAYNEERTIVATVKSVLQSDYPVSEVIVVDDGSTDGTGQVVLDSFVGDSRVRLISKTNGGKASALNEGIRAAQNELLFSIDADTHVEPDAIGLLAARFTDKRVGAVAGNVQVGNVINLLTAWQDVEYRTSQNLDRRAYESLNGITVVPGAIGMWRKSAVVEAGGYTSDTLAEDMDLTWRLRRLDYVSATEPRAAAWTEAPETWKALFKQRFRWAFGTTQCLWKHRSAIGRYGWFGRFVLPAMVLFQIVFQLLGPFVDLQLFFTLLHSLIPVIGQGSKELKNTLLTGPFLLALQLYAMFFALEFISGFIAYRMDRKKPWPLVWLLIQRFAYRQLMYLVMLKSLWRALTGMRQGWGKLKRTGKAAAKL